MNEFFDSLSGEVKHWIDSLSLVTLVGTLVEWLPHVATLFTVVWTAMRMYEMWRRWSGRPLPGGKATGDE